MDYLNEIRGWESNLRQELEGLKFCSTKVKNDPDIPEEVQNKFLKVISNLKSTVSDLISRCGQAENLPEKALKPWMERVRGEYNQTFKNISKLLSTVENPRQGHQDSTFTSRQMAMNRRTPNKKENNDEIKAGIQGLGQSINKIKTKVNQHDECTKMIHLLVKQNRELTNQVKLLSEEQRELRDLVSKLHERLEVTEKEEIAPVPSKKERYLLKPRREDS